MGVEGKTKTVKEGRGNVNTVNSLRYDNPLYVDSEIRQRKDINEGSRGRVAERKNGAARGSYKRSYEEGKKVMIGKTGA